MVDEPHDDPATGTHPTPVEHPPVPPGGSQGPPPGPRDPGDGWAYGPDGQKAWGTVGAAGLLVDDGAGRVLLQHRVEWSHYGGTWGIPGGARHVDEDAVAAALRESAEEAAVPASALRLRHTSVVDLGFWSYTTVVARSVHDFTPEIGDRESLSLDWVGIDAVDDLPLHPGFGASWSGLRAALTAEPHIVVDAANVVGSVPDGWWRDRPGAAERFLAAVADVAARGVDAVDLGLPFTTWWPSWTVVLEGDAAAAADPGPRAGTASTTGVDVRVVRAPGSGDDAIVDEVRAAIAARRARSADVVSPDGPAPDGAALDGPVLDGPVFVITADRELRRRVEAEGAAVRGPSWLRDRIR